MAPTKPAKGGSKGGKSKPSGSGSSSKKSSSKSFTKPKPSSETGISKRKQKSMALARPGGAQKSKSKPSDNKKKRRVYSEKELDIPTLNGIVPAGVAKPKGQKIGKKFVDDPASMMAIMSMVNAEKEGHIESKIMKARQLEEVREAKKKEAEVRSEEKKAKFEETKASFKKKKVKKHSFESSYDDNVENDPPANGGDKSKAKSKVKSKKRVSFG
ncbi:hypothetical protein K505DRAFT_366076 [Melanomma pulvis-pyrius CBS 109.77]|uniref:60S ribosomal subunit assembly/export protein loc1 n=1 Tax=Melanomma pulvis-pyrius CBS 109.77 TaxID=1314802 RepID=A0A6A6WXS1_9PLEO|nr:hypothetical protein K505DRAFT_366076 [Melanomma pulvis-pyrius CBS 109.77]